MTLATPVQSGPLPARHLLLQRLDDGGARREDAEARVLWKGKSDNEIQTDGLHATINTPIVMATTSTASAATDSSAASRPRPGERVWETQSVTKEKARWASGLMVRHGERVFINNDRGDLIIGAPEPTGFHEISRTFLIKPTSPPGNRRELTDVNWSHPAYANRHIYARNDEEIIAASLAVDGR